MRSPCGLQKKFSRETSKIQKIEKKTRIFSFLKKIFDKSHWAENPKVVLYARKRFVPGKNQKGHLGGKKWSAFLNIRLLSKTHFFGYNIKVRILRKKYQTSASS